MEAPTEKKELKKWFKNRTRLTWIADAGDCVPITKIELDHLIIPDTLPDGVDWAKDWREFVTPETWKEQAMFGEQGMRNLKKGEIIQLQRVGFFIVEQPYVSKTTPMKLIFIPDGSEKVYKS